MRIAIVGAGLGGCAAAVLLARIGYEVTVYEQAPSFSRLGAGIHLSPNVTRILRRIGIEGDLGRISARPPSYVNRAGDTGEVIFDLRLGDWAERRYGAPYLVAHRGDFHALLTGAVGAGAIAFGKRLVGVVPGAAGVRLIFEDGSAAEAEMVIGADGINSKVREILLGPEAPRFTGYIAHRAIFPTALLGGAAFDDCTKWWLEDRHFIAYFITGRRDELYLVTGVPAAGWPAEVASMPGDIDEFRADFAGFEPRVRRILDACPEVAKWPILERDPLPLWGEGRIVLLGDACHPMKPHMGQGAAMAIEDAAMLARCFETLGAAELDRVFRLYKANRLARTSRVQRESHRNEWMRHELDPGWVFGYDVFTEPLVEA